MATSASMIKRHVNRLSAGELFTTRDLLGYGLRYTVDNVLSRMVKRGEIDRVARGVFMKPTSGKDKYPSSLDILKAKMRSWGKVFYHDPVRTGTVVTKNGEAGDALVVFVSGSNSSFFTSCGIKVVLKHIGPRKMKLSSAQAGQFARRIWNAGEQHIANFDLIPEWKYLGRDGFTAFLKTFRLLPAWLNDIFFKRRMHHFGFKASDIGFADHEILNE